MDAQPPLARVGQLVPVELSAFVASNFQLDEVRSTAEREEYLRVLEGTYRDLGFLQECVYPRPESNLFILRCLTRVAGICALTPADEDNAVRSILAEAAPEVPASRILELTNFIVAPEFRGSIAVGYMLYGCAQYSWETNFTCIAGIVRYQVLRAFVDFGVVPVAHEPLHLLGNPDLDDFIIYYDTTSAESVNYMHLRAKRYFNEKHVMQEIRSRYLKPRQVPAALNAVA